MESRKDQLQKQIIEALKAEDNDLYILLKSQWAHRFGVESLEELNNLDLIETDENPLNEGNQIIDQSQEKLSGEGKVISLKENDNQEEEIIAERKKVIESVELENKESFNMNSFKIVDKENFEKKDIKPIDKCKISSEIQVLIPLPPKPKYSYLKKWLLRNKF